MDSNVQQSLNAVLSKITNLSKDMGLSETQTKELLNSDSLKELQKMVTTEEIPLEDLPDEVSIPWEQVEDLYQMRTELYEIQNYLAQFCVQYEMTRSRIMRDIDEVQFKMNQRASDIKQKNNIPLNAPFEIEIPEEPNNPATMRKVNK
jgi:small-conductance mechanosensitive channel